MKQKYRSITKKKIQKLERRVELYCPSLMLADNVISLVSLFFYKQTKIKKTIKEEEKRKETKQKPRK